HLVKRLTNHPNVQSVSLYRLLSLEREREAIPSPSLHLTGRGLFPSFYPHHFPISIKAISITSGKLTLLSLRIHSRPSLKRTPGKKRLHHIRICLSTQTEKFNRKTEFDTPSIERPLLSF